jgi:hypothetical protein
MSKLFAAIKKQQWCKVFLYYANKYIQSSPSGGFHFIIFKIDMSYIEYKWNTPLQYAI